MRSKAIILLAFLFIFGFVPEMSSQGIYIYKRLRHYFTMPNAANRYGISDVRATLLRNVFWKRMR